jgi:UPF0176 protein
VKNTYTVIIYYKYAKVKDVEKLKEEQLKFCKDHNIKGRIIVAEEGINGTVGGAKKDIEDYKKFTEKRKEFKDMPWKESTAKREVFPRISVKIRDEIVTLGVKKGKKDVDINKKAKYIEPEELLDLYESGGDFVIIDARNKYEADVGKFKDAVVPDIKAFKEFPEYAKKHFKHLKDKPVVTYCTAGVRCEKASAYLIEQGFKNVRQLHGGVDIYGKKTGGKNFEGELFVFDDRLHIKVNNVNPTVVAKCKHCGKKVTRLVDCAEDSCGKLFVCCKSCEKKHNSTCSIKCRIKHLVNNTVGVFSR